MKLANVATLYRMRLREQLGQELLALIGIAVGVALLFAALVANSSLTGSFERVTQTVVGDARFQLVARGGGSLDERKLAAVQRLPGVHTAAAVLEVRGEMRGPKGRRSVVLFGVTPELAELDGGLTREFSYGFIEDVRAVATPTPLADALGLELGQPVELLTRGRRVYARLGAMLQERDTGDLFRSPVAVAPLRYAQTLSGQPGEISRVFVRPQPGQEHEVKRGLERIAAARADVRAADFDAALFRQASQPTNQSTAMFSIFSAMVGFLFALSAVLLTVPKRRLLMADLQMEGFGPRTVLKILTFDALVLGVTASVLGILAGDQVARRLFEAPTFLEMAFPFGSQRVVTVENVAIAAGGGIVASMAAVLGPMAGALLPGATEPEHEDLRRPRERHRAIAVGLALLAGAALVVVLRPQSAAVGIAGLAMLTAALLVLLPTLLRLAVSLLEVVSRDVRSIVPFLATADLRDPTTRLRSLAVAATGAVAVFGSVALQGAHADLQRGLDLTSRDLAAIGDVWAVPPGRANLLATTPFSPPRLAAPDQRTIRRIDAYYGGFLDIGDRRVWVIGSPATAALPLPRGQIVDGDAGRVTHLLRVGGWAVVTAGIASEQGLRVGDSFLLEAPVPTRLRVAALSTNMGWPPGAIVINARDYEQAWGSRDVSAFHATLAPGASATDGAQALRSALGSGAGLEVQTSAMRERAQRAASREGLSRLTQIAALVLVSAMIAMAAAMAGMIWQRRAFLASMKVEGYATSELWRSLLLEAATLVGVGCAAGAVFGLLGQNLLSRALTSVTGFPVASSIALLAAAVTCIGVTVVAVAIIAVFGRRAAQVDAVTGLS